MRTQQKNITELYTEHKDWLKHLQTYKDDLGNLQKKLEDVAVKNTSYEARAHVERFQNQFIRQGEVIDELRHAIKQHENAMERAAKAKASPDAKTMINHVLQRQNFHRFVELFDNMRDDFNRFLSRA